MRCSKCGAKNDPEARFCSNCGSEIVRDTGKHCNSCGKPNNPDARFCSNCGAELTGDDKRECRSCRMRNDPDSVFCAKCGARLSADTTAASPVRETPKQQPPKTHKGRHVPPVRRRGYVAAALTVVGVTILVVVILQRSQKGSLNEGQVAVVETKLKNPVEESKAMQIAAKFDCSCGTCGDLSLDTCECPTAVKEREFIRKSVEQRMASDQIIAAVNKTYGHMKSNTNFVVPPLSGFGSSTRIYTNSGEN